MKKKKGKAKYDLKVVVPVVAGLGQALLPNLNLVDHQEITFYDLFLMHIVNIPQMNKIMHDPNIETILVVWPILKYHIIVYTLVQQ